MPCSPGAAILLTAHTMSCCRPQMELVVPKRMSGLTGSSGVCETAPHTLDGPTALAAAVVADHASADDINSRLSSPRPVTFTDMDSSPIQLPAQNILQPRRLRWALLQARHKPAQPAQAGKRQHDLRGRGDAGIVGMLRRTTGRRNAAGCESDC